MDFQKDRLDATPDRPQHDISPKGRLGPKQPLMSARGLSRGGVSVEFTNVTPGSRWRRRSLGFILGTFFARSKHLNILVEIWFALPTLLHLA